MADLAGRDIICLASQAWGSHRCTPQHIAERLAHGSRVLYVEPLRSPLVRFSRSSTQTRSPAGPPRQVLPNVWVLTLPPVFVPLVAYARIPPLRRINNALMSAMVGRAAAALGLSDTIAWVYQPTHQGAALLRRSALTVYDCIDEWAGATEDPLLKRYLGGVDKAMCATADVLFVGSQGLAAPRTPLNHVHALIPQGVDLAHFLPPRPEVEPPADMRAVGRPIIGLVGVLNRGRLDVELICMIADTRPDWTIVLVGPVWEGLDTAPLEARKNVRLLGNKPPQELGRYLAAFDVCMLPYLINDFTRNIFPLKLFEYLASGKPFVSTAVPACAEFPRLIRVADSHAAFLAALDAAVDENDSALRAERIAVACENDWDRRTADKAVFIAKHLQGRQPERASQYGREHAAT